MHKPPGVQSDLLPVLNEWASEGMHLSVEDRDRLLRQTLGLLLNVLHPGSTSEQTLIQRYVQDIKGYGVDPAQMARFLQHLCDHTFLDETDLARARLAGFLHRLEPHLDAK